MSKQPPPAPTASTVGPCPTLLQISRTPGTGSLPSTIAPPDHPYLNEEKKTKGILQTSLLWHDTAPFVSFRYDLILARSHMSLQAP